MNDKAPSNNIPWLPWLPWLDETLAERAIPPVGGKTLVVASDVGGEHDSSEYWVVSMFLCDPAKWRQWEAGRRRLRRSSLKDGRKISYKKLAEGQRWRSHTEFLEATNTIPGLLASVIARKAIKGLVTFPGMAGRLQQEGILKTTWDDIGFERLTRVAFFVSYFLSKVLRPRQEVLWISDEDPMFANDLKSADTASVASAWLSRFVNFELGSIGVCTTKVDEGDRFEEDLAAIPDMVAGALSHVLTAALRARAKEPGSAFSIPCKAKSIWAWIVDPTKAMDMVFIVFDKTQDGRVFSFEFEPVFGGVAWPQPRS